VGWGDCWGKINLKMEKTELIKKINEAVADMNSKVEFLDNAEHKHKYRIIATGEFLQGVSSVSSIVPKDWLSAWGSKECARFLGYSDYEGDTARAIEIKDKISKFTMTEYMALLREAKGASARKSGKALVDGKAGHALLEEIVKARIAGKEIPAIPEGTLQRPISQWLAWEKDNVDTWVLSEAMVAHLKHKFGGTLDGMAIMKSGALALIDFKFSSHISEDYFLQTAGYQSTFEQYGIKIDKRIIIRLPKTLEREEWDNEEHKHKMVSNDLEVMDVATDYEEDKLVFISALPVKKWCNHFTSSKY
jgi:hypothetical protein